MLNCHQHIAADPEVMCGRPCIKGTSIPVDLILDKLAGGQPIEDLLKGYPAPDARMYKPACNTVLTHEH